MPTLLVFAKEPRPGRVKTRLAASVGAEAACALYRAFLADLAAAFRSFEIPVAWWVDGDPEALRPFLVLPAGARGGPAPSPVRPGDEAGPVHAQGPGAAALFRQPPGDLGVRLAAAFRSAFDAGGGPVAAIGTDCPLLGPGHVRKLFGAVDPGAGGADAALLPAADGGYVGLALAALAPETFVGVPWSTERVARVTAENLRQAGRRVTLLPPLYDVDEEADLARLAADLAESPERAPATAAALAGLGLVGAPSAEAMR